MRAWIPIAISSAAAAALSLFIPSDLNRDELQGNRRQRVEVNRSALARILGEFRTGTSDLLFLKTERYLHGGVGYVPHQDEASQPEQVEENSGHSLDAPGPKHGHGAHDHDHGHAQGPHDHDHGHAHGPHDHDHGHAHGPHDHNHGHGHGPHDHDHGHAHGPHDHDHGHGEHDHDHNHAAAETLIPSEQQDYRGWIGRMQREVKPWRDPSEHHLHSEGNELIPWFRMMTLSDPAYVRGYILGAFWVQSENLEAAQQLIEEGLEHNPYAFQLHQSRAMLQLKEVRGLSEDGSLSIALPEQKLLLEQALEGLRHATELMMEERPKDMSKEELRNSPRWGRYKELDALAVSNSAVTLEAQFGDPEAAEALKERVLQVIPDHIRLSKER